VSLSYEQFFLLFGVLAAVGLFVSFEVAAILGVLAVIGLSIWARRASTVQCPACGAAISGSAEVCKRCGHEL
jgi:rRNA maturation endonuclease Nob1